MIYTVTFNPAWDYIIHVNDFKTGEVNRTELEEIQFGGKGINVSTVLKNLGFENKALGFIAGFTGAAFEQGLKKCGINTDFIELSEGMTRINVKLKSNSETEINGQGPKITSEAIDKLFAKLDEIQNGDILVLAGSIPNTLSEDIYERIMERLQNKDIKIVVDATKDLLLNVLKYKPFLIKPNNHELGELFGHVLKTDDEIIECARELQKKGARNVLISMAGDGAILISEKDEIYKIGVPSGKVINSVGAGDSMVAGFIAGYLKTENFEEALKMGTAAGSATAFSLGLATKEKVDELLKTL